MAESKHHWSRSKYPLHANTDGFAPHGSPGHDPHHEDEVSIDDIQDERRTLRRTPRLAELAKAVDPGGVRAIAANTVAPVSLAAGVDLGLATEYSLGQHRSIEKALAESVDLGELQRVLRPSTSSATSLKPQVESAPVAEEHAHSQEPTVAPSLVGSSPPKQESSDAQHRVHGSSPSVKVASRSRRGYPLQSPASTKNLRYPPSPPSSSSESEPQRTEGTATNNASAMTETSRTKKASRRKGYPLQSPASIGNLLNPPSPPPSPDRSAEDKDETSTDLKQDSQQRENALAAKVVKQWTRQTYPPPPIHSEPPSSLTDPPQVQEKKSEYDLYPEPIHLPKTMRAATDSTKAENTHGRTIVVALDGTGDKFDNDNSNIVHIVSALKKDDPNQVTYYQAGIGTYGDGGLSGGFTAAADMAVGASLGTHVRDAYHFLMHSYKEGDNICIFGFSRGAYTARCLAGMIHKVGLLPPRNLQQIPFAYDFYKDDTPEGWKQSEAFKATFSIHVCVYFLGCFDSVSSVGFIPRQLPLSSTPTSKSRYFRHAMSLDERRAKFKVSRFQTRRWEDIDKAYAAQLAAQRASWRSSLSTLLLRRKAQDDHPPDQTEHALHSHPTVTDDEYEALKKVESPFETDVLEVWFAGDHADVGGGAVANSIRHKAAQIPLRWMIRQAFECNTGIIFNTAVLAEFGLDVHTLWPTYSRLSIPGKSPAPSYLDKFSEGLPPRHVRRSKLVPSDSHEQLYRLKSRSDEDWTPELIEDFFDMMAPLHDQLELAPNWWILEYIPVEYLVPVTPGEVVHKVGMNLGRARGVTDKEPLVHWTVLHRMQHTGYKIKARTAPHTMWRPTV